MKALPELNGKRYRDLEKPRQKLIRNSSVRTITFKRESGANLRFEIFERLNTGAVPLNRQGLRNCIYRGPYNQFLIQLSADPDYMWLMGLKQAEAGPLLLIVEDLHWSDQASLEFLLYLVRRLADHPMLLVLSFRRADAQAGLVELLAGLDREPIAQEIRLKPLTRAEVAQLLQAILAQPQELSAEFVAAIYSSPLQLSSPPNHFSGPKNVGLL